MLDLAAEEYKAIPGNEKWTIDFQFHQIMKWGYFYYPKVCLEKACKFSFIIHGCGGHAYKLVKDWAPVAKDNEIVLVFPQGAVCWNNFANFRD